MYKIRFKAHDHNSLALVKHLVLKMGNIDCDYFRKLRWHWLITSTAYTKTNVSNIHFRSIKTAIKTL